MSSSAYSRKYRQEWDEPLLDSKGIDVDLTNVSEEAALEPPQPARHGLRLFLARASKAFIVCLALWGIIALFFQAKTAFHDRKQREPVSCNCGASVAEAMSRGCKYDPIAVAWLPNHCRDDELNEEFRNSGDGPDGKWLYYTDRNKTSILTEEEVSMLADNQATFWMAHRWHYWHCMFVWRRHYRLGRYSDAVMYKVDDSEGHIMHCNQALMRRDRLDSIVTFANVTLNADIV